MTRTELALALLSSLERKCDGLIHPFGANGDVEYDVGEIVAAILEVTDTWSREIWLRGAYATDERL